MEAILFEVKGFFYSYKVPLAYQVKASNLLVPPSALLGAIYKSYVRETGLNYTGETLSNFLKEVRYVGLAILPKEGLNEVLVRRSELTRRLWRYEREVEIRSDAMVREYVYLHGQAMGVISFESPNRGFKVLLARALEGIEYLGDSESIVSVRVLDENPQVLRIQEAPNCREGYMAQLIADNVDRLPKLGVIEQCGRVPRTPWGVRQPGDICYVWQPLAPRTGDRYKPLKYSEIEQEIEENTVAGMWCVKSGRVRAELVFSTAGFECLSIPAGTRGGRGRG